MYSFVVLGQVPGTNIIISFTMWVQLALMLTAIAVWYVYVHKHAPNHGQEHPSNVMIKRNGRPVRVNEITL